MRPPRWAGLIGALAAFGAASPFAFAGGSRRPTPVPKTSTRLDLPADSLKLAPMGEALSAVPGAPGAIVAELVAEKAEAPPAIVSRAAAVLAAFRKASPALANFSAKQSQGAAGESARLFDRGIFRDAPGGSVLAGGEAVQALSRPLLSRPESNPYVSPRGPLTPPNWRHVIYRRADRAAFVANAAFAASVGVFGAGLVIGLIAHVAGMGGAVWGGLAIPLAVSFAAAVLSAWTLILAGAVKLSLEPSPEDPRKN